MGVGALVQATPEQWAVLQALYGPSMTGATRITVVAPAGFRPTTTATLGMPPGQENLPVQRAAVEPAPAPLAKRFVFSKAGSYWLVTFDGGKPFPLPPTLGAEYLDYLLHHPSDPISAYDLEMVIRPEKAKARAKDTVQNNLDAKAVGQYLRQLDDLRGQRAEAAEDGDLATADRLDEDIDAIEAAMNQPRQAPDAGERSRGNVSKAIAAVLRRLRKGDVQEKAFAQHLNQFISPGYLWCYNQPKENRWA